MKELVLRFSWEEVERDDYITKKLILESLAHYMGHSWDIVALTSEGVEEALNIAIEDITEYTKELIKDKRFQDRRYEDLRKACLV